MADDRGRARSFGAVAVQYAALRPGYPTDAVTFVLGDRERRRVLDLGAGTGLLTQVVAAAGHGVIAVDPSVEMLGQLRARLPAARAAVGAAESIPLADGSVDAVVAGQAAHWFDPEPAARELRRVLRPGGVVGLIWNLRDQRVPWVAAVDDLLREEIRDHAAGPAIAAEFVGVLPATETRFRSGIVQRYTLEQVIAVFGTRSYAALMAPGEREAFLDRIRRLLATHPDTRGRSVLELPYVTVAHRLVPV